MSISERMHMPEVARRMEVFTGTGRRRTWSVEEKAAIVAESYGSGESVCAVARRHALTPQQVFSWRREARRSATEPPATFVPAVVEPASAEPPVIAPPASRPRRRREASGIALEIGGVAVHVGSDASPRAIAAVIRALKAVS